MAVDYALVYHPTDSLLQPAKRFFPFSIPNHHEQLRHYISTADPDRIFVASDRTVFAIHVSSQKVETLAVIPFGPKCLTAGHGWIGLGGAENGECAFIKLPTTHHEGRRSDVDSALPIDLDSASGSSSLFGSEGTPGSGNRHASRRLLPEVQLHRFGGSIVNSVTVHCLPGNGKDVADEIVMVLSNNDRKITIYSLTRARVLRVLNHPACMNYAIISPDSTLLAAVGDENRVYFYGMSRNWETTQLTEDGDKLTSWEWKSLRCIEMDIGSLPNDKCCFTIAFSPSSHLCAVASQSGVITVFDVDKICDESTDSSDDDLVLSVFHSSRFGLDVGAVRSMAFSPEPWDLLVWVENHGRIGVADVRHAFLRRQVVDLDSSDPSVQKLPVAFIPDDSGGSAGHFEIRTFDDPSSSDEDTTQRAILDAIEGYPEDQSGEDADRSSLRVTERELILEFLNTARWTSRTEESLAARAHGENRPRVHGYTERANRNSRPSLPLHSDAIHDILENASDDSISAARAAYLDIGGDRHPPSDSIPSQESGDRPHVAGESPISALEALSRQRLQRLNYTLRRSERPETERLLFSESRGDPAAARIRRQRQLANEVPSRASQLHQRRRQSGMGLDHSRPSRWVRGFPNDSPAVGLVHRDRTPGGTAGIGWGADRRSLYIGTVDGIFEFQVDTHDRKTFPDISYR